MIPFDASTQAVRNDPSHNCSKRDMQSLAAPVEEPAFVTLGQIAEQQQQQLQQQLQEEQQQQLQQQLQGAAAGRGEGHCDAPSSFARGSAATQRALCRSEIF